jgi:TonB family protein
MINEDSLNKYIFVAFLLHSLFLVTFSIGKTIEDITTIGETGMNVQMIVLQKSDEVYDQSISEEERNITEDSKKDQDLVMDDRKVGDQSKLTYDTYYGKIREIIDSNKRYPLLSRQRREEGSPKVHFTILKNGIVTDLSISSSGYRTLDREARRMILVSSPFPRIPNSMNKNFIRLTIPINFSLQTY